MTEPIYINHYARLLDSFSKKEMALFVQVKRFFEWCQGDPDFRKSVETGAFSQKQIERLRQIGVTFELNEVAMLWKKPELFARFIRTFQFHNREEHPDTIDALIEKYPLLEIWGRFVRAKTSIYKEFCRNIFPIHQNKKFNNWRLRRISAVRSELGFFGYYIDHPTLAFELSDGCSIGCWFCAFSSRKLTQNFNYVENGELFRRIVQICVDLFGHCGAGMALLYYGTEPHDNPNYLDFVKDHTRITGCPTCTSTAVPTDAKWLRELISFYRQGPHPWPRLSVLSRGMLFKIHDLYSPEELRDVELLMQMKDNPRKKVTGGRILEEQGGLRDRQDGGYLDDIVPQGSIACVSGFLINLVHRTIQVVSPCYTSKTWPNGYRIFDTETFVGADGFRQAIECLIERNMPDAPFSDRPVRFRDDLTYGPTDNGFDLVSPNQVHHFQGKTLYGSLGGLIAKGCLTYEELCDAATVKQRLNPLMVVAVMKKLFDAGFLDEVNPNDSNARATYSL